jgi:uncharacterized protein YbdZ (MbtH family)
MKKVLTVLMLSFMFLIGLSFITQVQAEDEIVDLYPYNQEACLLAEPECSFTKVGNSNWTFTYYGHRYHVIKDLVRYGHEMVDDNSDGWIEDSELAGIPYNAFASVFMNNTDSEIDILTANERTDITDVVHRKYAHFDENGVLQMFEDHISKYYIYNDGDALAPDWRLATQAEIDLYDAEVDAGTITSGNPSSDGLTRLTHIRIALDDVDTDGYVVEPLKYLKWTNADVDTATELDETKWSTIVADNPNNLYIPAGWTVVSFGTNDRGTLNTLTRDYIESLPASMVDDTVAPMFMTYTDQPAWFNGITALDNDAETPGVNIVVDYNGTFTLPTTVSTQWRNMFDDVSGDVINSVEGLDYQVEIFDGETSLETITYTWDAVAMAYTASGEQTVIDTSAFGSLYNAVFSATTPEGDVTEVNVDIVVGVMPPKFSGVENRYADEDMYVDVMEGITADDGYGNDKTDDIVVTLPDGFNPYYPQPGEYEIELEFNHHVHFDGVTPVLEYTYNSTDYSIGWDPETKLNADVDVNVNCTSGFCAWNDLTNFRDATSAWGSVFVVIGADGKIDEIYNRYNWEYTTETGVVVGDADNFAAWQAALTIEDGGFVMGAHGSASCAAQWRYMAYDDQMNLVIGSPDFDYDILTSTSYTLVIDDLTDPTALIVNDQYSNANKAILANIVAFDNFDPVDDLAIYVSDNGGLLVNTAGTYTVEVTVEDMAGNSAVVEFDVEVVAAVEPGLTEAQVQALIDAQTHWTEEEIQALIDAVDTWTEEEIQALIDATDTWTEAEIQALIDASIPETPETGCGASAAIAPTVGIIGLFALLGTAFVAFRRHF